MTEFTADYPEFQLEARDTERAISYWNERAKLFGKPPPIGKFDLSSFTNHSFRFLMCADTLVPEDSVFLSWGPGLMKLLNLSERPTPQIPMRKYIPHRYRFLFTEGCSDAINEAAPVRFSGELAGADGGAELYRACFMPLLMANEISRMICGSFNFLTLPAGDLRERSRSSRLVDPGDLPSSRSWREPGN